MHHPEVAVEVDSVVAAEAASAETVAETLLAETSINKAHAVTVTTVDSPTIFQTPVDKVDRVDKADINKVDQPLARIGNNKALAAMVITVDLLTNKCG